jgi:predicted ATPase
MLTRLDIKHFKCFELLKLPLGSLTLLSGSNASGKSSALQALVLLHQTMKEAEWSTRLMMNGGELQLGTVTDVVDKVTGRRQFAIALVDDGLPIRWVFGVDDRRAMSAQVMKVDVDGTLHSDPPALHFLLPVDMAREVEALAKRMRRLTYLTAERIGPREVYPLQDPSITQVVGARGEHAVSLLHWGRDEHVLDDLVLPDAPPTRLRQVETHMRDFFPGCTLVVQQIPQANGVTLGLRTSDATDFHRPIHVGFGLTQVLPVVVAALSAQPGDLLLIENPEVHLHPAGQALMGTFLSRVAAVGVQVLVETHSDHVLNGMRRAVKAGVLAPAEVCLHFFRDRELEGDQVVSPSIDADGNLDAWPDGFFDQFDKDMNYFAGWGE